MNIYSTTPESRLVNWIQQILFVCRSWFLGIFLDSNFPARCSMGNRWVSLWSVWKCLGNSWRDGLILPFLLVINFEWCLGKGLEEWFEILWLEFWFSLLFLFFKYLWRNNAFLFYMNEANIDKDKIFIYTFV